MADQAGDNAVESLVEQLRTDVGDMAGRLMNLIGPAQEMILLEQNIAGRAEIWAAYLLGDDDNLAAETVLDLINVLWPNCEPTLDWWRTPIGRAVARSIGHPNADTVSYSVAGAMLGCTKQYVGKLVDQGRLQRGQDGGVATQSVRAVLRKAEDAASAAGSASTTS